MPKVTLSFTLPKEKYEFIIAQRGGDFYCAILEIQRIIRDHNKYGKKIEDAFEEIEEIVNDTKTDDIP